MALVAERSVSSPGVPAGYQSTVCHYGLPLFTVLSFSTKPFIKYGLLSLGLTRIPPSLLLLKLCQLFLWETFLFFSLFLSLFFVVVIDTFYLMHHYGKVSFSFLYQWLEKSCYKLLINLKDRLFINEKIVKALSLFCSNLKHVLV